jgi:AraC family transcriptional regulator
MRETLRIAAERDLSDLAKVDYVARVNRAIDHVMRRLDEPLPLDDVARVACFSPFHFHRIFRALVGETLAQFVKRARLERAIAMMTHQPDASLTDVALACGFASSSDFSRSFRDRYGVPPSALDTGTFRDARRAALQAAVVVPIPRLPAGANPDGFAVTIRDVPERRVAYERVTRPYEGGVVEAAERMLAWARARGFAGGQWLGYQWDDPEIVPLDRCRYDVGLEVPADVRADGAIGAIDFPPMQLAEIAIDGPIELEMRAIDWLFGTWLPTSGRAPDHQPMFEAWDGEPFADGPTRFRLRVQLPVIAAFTHP